MSRPSSHYLFRLIKSLTKNEKGYIKKMSSMNGEKTSHFIRLFDAIDGQETYDDEALMRSKAYGNNLPRLKNYLQERILAALGQYHSSRSIDMQLRNMLNQVTILFSKGFYDRCRAELLRTRELCREHEKFFLLLEVLEWERTLVIDKLLVRDLDRIRQEEHDVLKLIADLSFYKDAYDKIAALYTRVFTVRTPAEEEQYLSVIRTVQSRERATSFQARVLRCKSLAKYHAAMDDRVEYLGVAQEVVDLYEANEVFIRQDIRGYVRVLNNLITTLAENKEYERFDAALKKLEDLPGKYSSADNANLKDIIGIRILLRKFYRHFDNAEFDEGIRLIPVVQEQLGRHSNHVSRTHLYIFLYSISYLFFIDGKYDQALAQINVILNDEINGETIAYVCYAKILFLVIHYELGNEDLLEYSLVSVKKFLEKNARLYEPEKIVIDLLRKKLLRGDEETGMFRGMYASLEQTRDMIFRRSYEYFDLLAWAQSKAEGTSFRELLARRIRRE